MLLPEVKPCLRQSASAAATQSGAPFGAVIAALAPAHHAGGRQLGDGIHRVSWWRPPRPCRRRPRPGRPWPPDRRSPCCWRRRRRRGRPSSAWRRADGRGSCWRPDRTSGRSTRTRRAFRGGAGGARRGGGAASCAKANGASNTSRPTRQAARGNPPLPNLDPDPRTAHGDGPGNARMRWRNCDSDPRLRTSIAQPRCRGRGSRR